MWCALFPVVVVSPMNNITFKPSTEKANLFRNKAQGRRTYYFKWPLALSHHIPHRQNSSASICKTDTSKHHPLQTPTHNDHKYVLYNLKLTYKIHLKWILNNQWNTSNTNIRNEHNNIPYRDQLYTHQPQQATKHITPNSNITYHKVTLIAKTSVFTEQGNRCGKPSL